MRRMLRILLAAALTLVIPGVETVAGQTSYTAVRWGEGPQRVAALMRGLGFRTAGSDRSGDLAFSGNEEGFTVLALMHRGKLVGWSEQRLLAPYGRHQVFRSVVDSLTAIYGEPTSDSAAVSEGWTEWRFSDLAITVLLEEPDSSGVSSLTLMTQGPGYRARTAELVARWRAFEESERVKWIVERLDTIVWRPTYRGDSTFVSADPTRFTRPSPGVLRAWVRWDYRAPRRAVSGSERYDQVMEQVELQCSRSPRYRVVRRIYYRAADVVFSVDGPSSYEEVVPESVGEAVYKATCRLAGRR
jgi:hypothetical protein